MKAEFSKSIEKIAKKDKKIVFLTGDLGYNALENVRESIGNRFINAGIAEQNMVSVAAGMAYAGFKPWVYSIAPFLVLKTTEQIRNDVCHKNLSVKFVGMGGGFAYGNLASTHHLLEDIAILSSFPNIKLFIPAYSTDVDFAVKRMYEYPGPAYIRLSMSPLTSKKYSPFRNVKKGNRVTILVLGPLLSSVLEAAEKFEDELDIWVVTEIPLTPPLKFFKSVAETSKLIVVEEHVLRGGLGELINNVLQKKQIKYRNSNLYSKGYPSKLYGSQKFHLKDNGLDPKGIISAIKKIIDE